MEVTVISTSKYYTFLVFQLWQNIQIQQIKSASSFLLYMASV